MQIVIVKNPEQGIEKAKEILYEHVDKKTVLFLSGGSSPKPLYEILAKEKVIRPIAVGQIDERYGEKLHAESNELMIKDTGLLHYLEKSGIPFYPILQRHPERSEGSRSIDRDSSALPQNDEERTETAKAYDERTRALFFQYPKSVAVMGIGKDGHTAGILPVEIKKKKGVTRVGGRTEGRLLASEAKTSQEGPQKVSAVNEENDALLGADERQDPNDFVVSYTSDKMVPPERITMTFTGLHLIDFFVVLVFGKEKKKMLKKMLENGPVEEMPSRFFNQEVSDKTVVITDQRI